VFVGWCFFYDLVRSQHLLTESHEHDYINEIWHDGMSVSCSSSSSLMGKTTNGPRNLGGGSYIASTWCDVWKYK